MIRRTLALLLLAAALAACSIPEEGGQAAPAGDAQPEQPAAGLNDPVRDGKFQFIVRKLQCGRRTVGANEYTRVTAAGAFCLVTVEVSNIGEEPQYLDSSAQLLLDDKGRRHAVHDEAWAALDQAPLLDQVNPGNTVEVVLVYDVPKGTKATRLELHDSSFSGGVTVALS